MLKKINYIFIILLLLSSIINCNKNDKKVDIKKNQSNKNDIQYDKYQINDLDEYLKLLKKALIKKDNYTILKLSRNRIGYDVENYTGSISSTEKILNSGFDYDLCLKLLSYTYEKKGFEERKQISFPPEKRNVDEKYTLFLENQDNKGWLLVGIYLVPYEYIGN